MRQPFLKVSDLKKSSTSHGGQIVRYSSGDGATMTYNKKTLSVWGVPGADFSGQTVEPDHPDDAPKNVAQAKQLFVSWANTRRLD